MTQTIHFDSENFQREVINSNQPVLVDFWAHWCGPCRAVGPTIEGLATKVTGIAKVGKLNIDESPEMASQYQVSSIPTVLVFKQGRVVDRFVGVQSEETYHAALRRATT